VRYRDPAQHTRSKTFTRKADAERWLAENETSKYRGGWVDPLAGRITVGEWAPRWYATTAGLAPSTRRTYRMLLANQILPTFEDLPIGRIDKLMVREWVAHLVETGLSPARIRNAHQVLGQILAAAIEAGRITTNPASGVRLPRIIEREMAFLTAEQVSQLADAIASPYGMLILFAGWTGLRPGELAALKVRRLDLLRGTCEVAESVSEVDGVLVWGANQDICAPHHPAAPLSVRPACRVPRRSAARPRRPGVQRADGWAAARGQVHGAVLPPGHRGGQSALAHGGQAWTARGPAARAATHA
jgi:hypothetical protein